MKTAEEEEAEREKRKLEREEKRELKKRSQTAWKDVGSFLYRLGDAEDATDYLKHHYV